MDGRGADGRWHGWVTMGLQDDGSPDRRHRTGKTEAEVTTKVRDLERKRDAGNTAKPGRAPTVEQWLRTWLATVAPRTVKQATLDSTYRPKVEHWIIPRLGKHRLDKLRAEHLDAFYLWLAEQQIAPNTVLQIHRILSRALKIAVRRELVGRNICQLIDSPDSEDAGVEPLTEEEARAILTAARNRRNSARWGVGLSLGVRQCETLGLRWTYLDLDTGASKIYWQVKRRRYAHGCTDAHACGAGRHTAKCAPHCTGHARSCPERTGGGWYFVEPKGKGKATLMLPAALVAWLREHRKAQLTDRLRAGEHWAYLHRCADPHRCGTDQHDASCAPNCTEHAHSCPDRTDWDLVSTTETGHPIDPRADWADWKTLLAEAGVRDAKVHDARHTAATLLLEQGVDVAVVQQILRHSQIQTTRRYVHVTEKLGTDAAERMGQALWGTPARTATRTATTNGRRGRR